MHGAPGLPAHMGPIYMCHMSVRGRSTRRRSSMALLSLLAGAPLVASSAWVQDRFAISFWVR